LKAMEWGTTLTAMVTPMNSVGAVDTATAVALAKDIIDNGCDGVILCGTTGEAATLTREEKLALFAAVGDAVAGKGLVIAGVGSNSTRETVELIRQADKLPVDGYMIITPYYNKPNQAGMVEHYKAAAAASTKPIMLYNVPSRTGIDLSLEDYQRVLSNCPGITAVKESGADFPKASRLVSEFPEVAFFSGNDIDTLPLMLLGFKGVVSVAANVVPAAVSWLTKQASQGNWEGARRTHVYLTPLFAALFSETNPVPVKAALEFQGWPVGSPRLPLARLSAGNCGRLRAIMKDYTREGH
jgi:4-hydroxy-tetrahydrodipicolinate synthase